MTTKPFIREDRKHQPQWANIAYNAVKLARTYANGVNRNHKVKVEI
jgi:hypothetical protein